MVLFEHAIFDLFEQDQKVSLRHLFSILYIEQYSDKARASIVRSEFE